MPNLKKVHFIYLNRRNERVFMSYRRLVEEINLDAADHNIKSILKRVDGRAKVIGVIKADAYGHGAVEMAHVLINNGVDMFAVAMLDEAIYLRKNGIKEDIIILGITQSDLMGEVIENNAIQVVSSFREAKILSDYAVKHGKTARVHIKSDTGMGRIGFMSTDESVEEICRINELPNLNIEGIFTHFATADSFDKAFTEVQKERFVWMINHLEERGISLSVRHAANSAGIMDFEDLFFTHVRAGIILYGMYPSDEVMKDRLDLEPVMSVKTRIAYIKTIEKGTTIGYGRTYTAPSRRVIATIPIGYADGYSRGLSNKGAVLVRGQKAPIVGRVCMDQCMIDITDIEGVQVEDEVVVMGKQGNNEISADMIAELLDTINYEIVCMFSKRVPKVYLKGGKVVKTNDLLI